MNMAWKRNEWCLQLRLNQSKLISSNTVYIKNKKTNRNSTCSNHINIQYVLFHELPQKYVKTQQAEFRILEEKCGQHFNLLCLRVFFQKSFNLLPQSKNTHYLLTGDSNLPQIQSVWLKGGLIWVGVCEGHPHHPRQRQMDSRCSR